MTESLKTTHFQDLLRLAHRREASHPNGVAIQVLPSLIPRSDGASVFAEGEAFSGIERRGVAEACLTITASPHVAPTLMRREIHSAAERVLAKPVTLPAGMQEVSHVSPQLILWWQEQGNGANTDMLYLATLPSQQRDDFCSVIATQTERAVQIIEGVDRKPIIWGSWGNGTLEERREEGKSRGVPTNKKGHLHITHFDIEEQNIIFSRDIPATERLNHYGPWNELVHGELRVPFARIIGRIGNDYLQQGQSMTVEPIAEFTENPNGTTSSNFGYELSFPQPRSLQEIYGLLIGVSGNFENFYQRMTTSYEEYHKHQADPDYIKGVKQQVKDASITFGFTEEEAERFVRFVLAIRPTYGQLDKWEGELTAGGDENLSLGRIKETKKRYKNFLAKIGDDPGTDSLSVALIRDTITPPEKYKTIERTWPVHSSAAFIIDDFTVLGGEVQVNGLKLFPGVAATEACVERVFGTIVKRSLSY